MDDVEKPIAHQLRIEVAGQGLTVDYLACPAWDQWVPDRLTCTGYFDGVPAKVRVRLSSTTAGAVTFTAALGAGIIATHNLVRTLERRGYGAVDCGHVAAYPATIGTRVTCSVTRDGRQKYVVATVTSRTGRVMIRDY